MAFEGELKDLGLGDIFQTIQQNRQTGTLSLSIDLKGKARIHFDEGRIALYSPDETPGAPFGDILRRLEVVPEKELALAEKKRGRKGLRTVLEERKLLTEEDYKAAAEKYLKDEVADLFLRARGRFQFQEGEAPRGAFDADLKLAKAAVDPQAAALEGLRRQDEWTRISRQIRSFNDVFLPTRFIEKDEQETLTAEARRLHALLDGCRSLEECMAELPCGRFGTGSALVELLAVNLVEPASGDQIGNRAKEAENAGDFAEAERLYRRALEIERNHLALREGLARLLERLGRLEDAGRERTLLGLGRAGDRDLQGAIAEYKKAAEFLPSDTAALERVLELELERDRRDAGGALAAGKRLAERYASLKLWGRARDLYRDLVHEFPEDVDLKARHAETLAQLGDRREAAAAWKEIAKLREKQKDEAAALTAYERAAEVDHEDKEARSRGDLIRSGRLQLRRARVRHLEKLAAATLVLALFAAVLVREGFAFSALHQWKVRALHPIAGSDGRALYEGFAAVSESYPFTLTSMEARSLADAAIKGEIARIEALGAERSFTKARARLVRLEALGLPPGLDDQVREARRRLDTSTRTGGETGSASGESSERRRSS